MSTISPLLRIKERFVGPSGIYNIQNEWYGYADEFKYTIGLAGLMGFGVGCCPPELLPADMMPLPGAEDRFSPNYGNYIHLPSASIQCFIPAHFMDVQSPGNTNAPFYGSKIVISSTQSGDAVLPRAFQNNGGNLAGVFVDKYQGSNCRPDGSGLPNSTTGDPGELPNAGGIFASRPLHWPVSSAEVSGTTLSPFSRCDSNALNPAITAAPTDTLGGVWQLCKTRGADFAPIPVWVCSQIAFLSLAHAQALLDTDGLPIAGATTNAAWMDVAPNAPKGNNNNGGSDTNKTSLQFSRTDIAGNVSGFAGENFRAFTGAAWIGSVSTSAVEHTTHNGQLSGIVDVNGNQWDAAPGLTTVGADAGDYRLFSASGDWTATLSNTSITSQAGVISLAGAPTVNATDVVDGTLYRVLTVGTTDWTAVGASANTVGTVFTAANAPGTGNGTATAIDEGVWWEAAFANRFLVAHADGTFHPSSEFTNATLRAMTECLLPKKLGTSLSSPGANIFGGDRFASAHQNDLLPVVGGRWANGAGDGVFSVRIGSASNNLNIFGARAVRLLSA